MFDRPGKLGPIAPFTKFERHRDLLLASLSDSGTDLNNGEVGSDIVEEARDGYWVKYRVSNAGEWMSVHPANHNATTYGFRHDFIKTQHRCHGFQVLCLDQGDLAFTAGFCVVVAGKSVVLCDLHLFGPR